jgi:L-lactate dehydrogenase complex protein LldG
MQDYSESAAAAANTGGQVAAPNPIQVFLGVLRDFHTVPHLAGNAKETVDILREIVAEIDPRSVVVAGLPTPARMLVESALKGVNHRFVEELKASEAVGIISKAGVGITWAQYGAAGQGCIVEVAYDDAIKLASSLPTVHIALLSSKDLLPDLPAAVARVGELLRADAQGQRKPVVSIISGPSKTADIEMRLVYGVHGPHALHVLLLDWL